jgi:hypothetical protein
LHFLADRLRGLPGDIVAALLLRLGEAGLVRLWRRFRVVRAAPPNVIELPFIESRTKVFDLGTAAGDVPTSRTTVYGYG